MAFPSGATFCVVSPVGTREYCVASTDIKIPDINKVYKTRVTRARSKDDDAAGVARAGRNVDDVAFSRE